METFEAAASVVPQSRHCLPSSNSALIGSCDSWPVHTVQWNSGNELYITRRKHIKTSSLLLLTFYCLWHKGCALQRLTTHSILNGKMNMSTWIRYSGYVWDLHITSSYLKFWYRRMPQKCVLPYQQCNPTHVDLEVSPIVLNKIM